MITGVVGRILGGAWRVLLVAACAQFGISVVDFAIPTLAGFIKLDYGLTAAMAGVVVAAFPGGKVFGAYGAGVAADRVGERRVLLTGGVVVCIVALSASASPLPVMLAFFFVGGVAASATTPTGGRFILNAFPPERRGLANGIRQMMVPAAATVAAIVLPPIAVAEGWRVALVVAAAVAVAGLVPLAAFAVPATHANSGALPSRRALNRNVLLLTIWGSLLSSGQWAVTTFLALDLHAAAAIPLSTGLLLVALANGAGAVCRAGWGIASDKLLRWGRKPLLMLINATALLGSLLLFATPRTVPIVVLAGVAVVAGVGLMGFQGLWVTMLAEASDKANVGAATGIAVTVVTACTTISPPLLGLLADTTGSYRWIWLTLAGLSLVTIVPALMVAEPAEGAEPGVARPSTVPPSAPA